LFFLFFNNLIRFLTMNLFLISPEQGAKIIRSCLSAKKLIFENSKEALIMSVSLNLSYGYVLIFDLFIVLK